MVELFVIVVARKVISQITERTKTEEKYNKLF